MINYELTEHKYPPSFIFLHPVPSRHEISFKVEAINFVILWDDNYDHGGDNARMVLVYFIIVHSHYSYIHNIYN